MFHFILGSLCLVLIKLFLSLWMVVFWVSDLSVVLDGDVRWWTSGSLIWNNFLSSVGFSNAPLNSLRGPCGSPLKASSKTGTKLSTDISHFPCSSCRRQFSSEIECQIHAQTCSITCRVCGKQFSSRANNVRHMKTFHTSVRAFRCPFCDRSFKHKFHMKDHLEKCRYAQKWM